MTATDAFQLMISDALHHRWESLTSALAGVDEDLALRGAAVNERSDGGPREGTILWHLEHVAHSSRHYANVIRSRPVVEEPDTPAPTQRTLAGLTEEAMAAHDELSRAIGELSESDLDTPCARGMTTAHFISMAIRHTIWHVSRMMAIRRTLA